MDKLLLNGVGTLGSVDSTYIVGLISFIIIGVSLLIILYRIVKWMIRLDEMMTSLVAQTYIQPQKTGWDWFQVVFWQMNTPLVVNFPALTHLALQY